MPLSALPIMKALLWEPTPRATGKTTRARAPKTDPKLQLATLMPAIIDKLQVLALKRPRALIVVAKILDALLKRQLEVLDEDDARGEHRPRQTTVEPSRGRRHRRIGR
jgi:hypothetical protein